MLCAVHPVANLASDSRHKEASVANSHTPTIRRHKRRTDDGKGLRRMIAGRRFRLPTGVDSQEADRRFARIEDAWQDNESFCRRFRGDVVWTELGLWVADLLRACLLDFLDQSFVERTDSSLPDPVGIFFGPVRLPCEDAGATNGEHSQCRLSHRAMPWPSHVRRRSLDRMRTPSSRTSLPQPAHW